MRTRIEILPDPRSPETHKLVKATTRGGYVYAVTWAEPWPTQAEAEEAWRTERRHPTRGFRPYNETTGAYL
ncbi:MAG TPA: hypothetical protein VFX29_05525 [Longimicrobiaceae bacterium]|nr:hypothetical protein [Longimicrobiaceae bacterium]